jgi:signal peptidase I
LMPLPLPYPRRLVAALCWACIGFALALLAAGVAPLALGMHTYAVQSGSMTPAIDTGDLVITRTISPTEAAVGDIVMFKDPEDGGKLISHRVRAVHERHGRSYFVTRGDANTGFERWSVPDSGSIGEIEYRVPKLGFVIGGIGSAPGKLLLIVIPALVLLWLGLVRIWRPERVRAAPGTKPRGVRS